MQGVLEYTALLLAATQRRRQIGRVCVDSRPLRARVEPCLPIPARQRERLCFVFCSVSQGASAPSPGVSLSDCVRGTGRPLTAAVQSRSDRRCIALPVARPVAWYARQGKALAVRAHPGGGGSCVEVSADFCAQLLESGPGFHRGGLRRARHCVVKALSRSRHLDRERSGHAGYCAEDTP